MIKKQSGYVLLASTIIILSMGMLAAVSILYFANISTLNDRAIEQSNQAKGLANACAELGIQRLVVSNSFTGTLTSQIATGSCTYVITNPSAPTAQINASGLVGNVTRKVQLTLTLSPLSVTRWQEIP